MLRSKIWLCFALVSIAGLSALSCTTFMVADGGIVLMGDSEDAGPGHPLAVDPGAAYAFFLPGTGNGYGRIHLGWLWEGKHRSFQAGMNEMGLVYGLTSVPAVAMNPHPEKTYQRSVGNLFDRLMTQAANVDEAIELLQETGFDDLAFQIQIADSNGRSAVAGPGLDGELAILRKDESVPYQIATTFNLSRPWEATGQDSYVRFNEGREILAGVRTASEDPFSRSMAVLEVIHRERAYALGGTYTVYSTLYDPTSLTITHYPLSVFEDPIIFDLAAELAKGERAVALRNLVPQERLSEAVRAYRVKQAAGIGVAAIAVVMAAAVLLSIPLRLLAR